MTLRVILISVMYLVATAGLEIVSYLVTGVSLYTDLYSMNERPWQSPAAALREAPFIAVHVAVLRAPLAVLEGLIIAWCARHSVRLSMSVASCAGIAFVYEVVVTGFHDGLWTMGLIAGVLPETVRMRQANYSRAAYYAARYCGPQILAGVLVCLAFFAWHRHVRHNSIETGTSDNGGRQLP